MTLNNFIFRCRTGAVLLVCLFAFGCSNNVKVKGTVTYSDNGEPVKFGTVIFAGEKDIGRATINNGKYSAGLVKDGEGIPRGTYTIAADQPYIPVPTIVMRDMEGNPLQTSTDGSQEREYYKTREPKTIDINKSMTYDFQVERQGPSVQ